MTVGRFGCRDQEVKGSGGGAIVLNAFAPNAQSLPQISGAVRQVSRTIHMMFCLKQFGCFAILLEHDIIEGFNRDDEVLPLSQTPKRLEQRIAHLVYVTKH